VQVSALDDRIDELYGLPLADFTTARNALAKSTGGPDGARIKRLEKPTVVPWAVNQIYWHDRPLWTRLMRAGQALRTAQIAALKGRSADIRAASTEHRDVLGDAVDRALSLAREHKASPATDQLARMLEALSLAPEPPGTPGRFTELVQPSGFEALAGVTPAGRPAPSEPVKPAARGPGKRAAGGRQDTSAREAAEREAARKAEREDAESALAAATGDVERAAAAETRARARVESARKQIEEAEADLEQARTELRAAKASQDRARRALDRL
jgi:hypothetical protein